MFQPPRNRDAYASIRGYVYQIDRTIDRWLCLGVHEILELERGEDIDVVAPLFFGEATTEEETRLLEQIKYRERNITLRTAAVQEAMANFHDHRLSNLGTDLRFRFLTNAVVGCEQLNPFPNRVPGITLWEQISARELDDNEIPAAIAQMQQFLSNLPMPDGFAESVWSGWKTYLKSATPEEFKGYIDRFEWSTGQPDAERLPNELLARIISLGFARDDIEAQALCDRLFVHVSRLLGKAGTKRLTAEVRSRLVAEPTLPVADREALSQLRAMVAGHTDRLARLEAEIWAIGSQVEMQVFGRTSRERIELMARIPDISLPQAVARLSPRPKTVNDLCGLLSTGAWVSIHGGPDVGKSQLAIQVAAVHGKCSGWVRFHHSERAIESAYLLDRAIAVLAGWDHPPRRAGWYPQATSLLGQGSLVVLDDLPHVPGDDRLTERLIQFGEAASTAGLRILSTSQFELSVRLRHRLGEKRLQERPAPPFTDEEAGDLFRAYGAPDSFFNGRRLEFLNGLAAGHPLLLAATGEFLAGREWQYRMDEVAGLLRGDHTERVMPEVIDRLTRALGDPPRELLYRLTLAIGSFEHTEVMALAGVEPPVDRPRERFKDLLGAWVQRDTDTRFAVSPLVKPLGRSELAPVVRIRCYRELAELITRKGVMNQYEGERAILYNVEAGEFGRAITLYVLSLIAALKEKEGERFLPVIDKWRETPLPEELSVGTRLFVRAYQLAAFTKLRLDTQFIVRDVDGLLEEATERDGWGIVPLAVQNLGAFRTQDPARVLGYVRRAIELPKLYGPNGSEIAFDRIYFPDMLWMLVTDLRTPALLNQWFDAVEALPAGERQKFWTTDLARQAVWLVPNKLNVSEWEKPKVDQDWDSVLSTLSQLRYRAQRLERPLLEAVLTGMMLDIQGDRKRLDDLPDIAEPILSRWPNEPDVQFEVRGTWGRQYAYQRRPDLALPLLDAALSQAHSPNDHERLRCLLAANFCVADKKISYAEQARDLARNSRHVPPIEAARALGEYALSFSQLQKGQAGAIAAFPAWSEAMRQFFNVSDKDKIWRDLFVLFAHATSYLTQLAQDGKPPERTIEGETFVAPAPGFLVKDYMEGREKMYRAGLQAGVFWMMHQYSTAASVPEESAYWLKLTIEESRRTGAVFIQAASNRDAVAESLTNGCLEDAIEAGVFAGRGVVVHRSMKGLTRENFDGSGIDLTTEFRKLPEEKRQQGDYFSLITAIIPAAMWIVRLSLTDPSASVSAGKRVAAACRQLSDDEGGNRELWRTAAELFELSGVQHTNAEQILARVRMIEAQGEEKAALRVLGYVLATWHATPDEAIHCQLGCISLLLPWFGRTDSVHRLIFLPYIESYWRQVARDCRFRFRSPDLTVSAIEAALIVPEAKRVQAILSAAASGFRIRGMDDVLRTLRAEGNHA